MSEHRHRCGGSLNPADVEIRHEIGGGFLLIHVVPGLACDKCHEELLEERTAREIQTTLHTPSIWFTSGHPQTSAVEIKLPAASSCCVAV